MATPKDHAGNGADDPAQSSKGDQEEPSAFKGFLRVFDFGHAADYALESIAIIAAIASGVALAMVNIVIGQFISLLSDSHSTSGSQPDGFMAAVSKTALYFVYIGIVRFVCTYIYASLFTFVAHRLTRNIRHEYLRAAFSQEIGFFDKSSGSISMQATSNGKLIQSGIGEKLGNLVQASATFVAAFIIAFITQWKLTLIIIGMVPVLLIVVGGAAGLDAQIETDILKIHAQAASFAETTLAGVRTVHAFDLRKRVVSQYDSFLQNSFRLGMKKNKIYGVLFGGEYFIVHAAMGLAFWQGIAMVNRGEIPDLGGVFTVLFSVVIAASTVMTIAPQMVTFGRSATAAAELFTLIDRKSEIDPFDQSGERPGRLVGEVQLQNVSFSYPTRPDVTVLDNFSLRVPAGKVTALVGPSGSGKSTIIGLFERWYNPTAGTVRLDGKDIKDLNLKWLRTNVRLVQQEPVLFNGTVLENISNGLVGTPWETATPEEQRRRVEDAAKLAFAHDFITSLPQGYDTRIGERGGLLSGGQKQRIAIARSLISEPQVLLLDEATSALDPHAEGVVQEALNRASQNRTTIVIAHKLATIRNADHIVVMSSGRIAEQGRHDDLVAMNGIYHNLVKAQDLSPAETQQTTQRLSEKESTLDDIPGVDHPLVKNKTTEERHLASLKDREDFTLFKQRGLISTVVKLMGCTPELKFWYLLALISCIIGAALFPAQALLLGNILDVFSSPDMVSRGNFISLMFLVIAFGCLIGYFLLGWSSNMIAQTLGRKMRRELLDSVLRQDLRFFDRPENTIGTLTSRLDSYPQAVFEFMGFNVALLILALINLSACSILAISVAWRLGLVGVFAGLPPMLLAGWVRIRLEVKMENAMDKSFLQSTSVASETVMAVRTVSSLALEQKMLDKYTHELDMAIQNAAPSLFHMMIWFSMTQAIEYFVLALGFWWGSKLINDGYINFYQFIVSFMGVYFSGQATSQMFVFAGNFTKGHKAANYYFWMSALEPTIQDTPENSGKGPKHGCKSFDLENVQFAYPLAPHNRVLKGISLTIQPGEFVAFVGPSGCGKSTMVSLLQRFYDPVSGTINVDSSPLNSISPSLYRKNISLVQQEPTLFPGTIRDNISQGVDTTTTGPLPDFQLEEACRSANVWDFIASLPEGLDTPCGTGGSQLSGGQRQRIAIARALIRKPAVILLDEATSALDTESERIVQGALKKAATTGNRITIAVAHRLSTIRDASRIFVFNGGIIAESGTHGELIERGGMYAKMCEAQRLGQDM
ncbi:multidrug/pheromone exporter [Colletotrichum higginsianum]|uniref:Multidrug/pheromone exporter n=1 Tax=Colletotrichum higginsianum (strain IMI 349063) TaxID=759273 RepID=H1V667_COLHI|nr:Multidrug/pheromone exporter [Colletotrichum higginsianum IMI 349063]OBR11294.1 Multidrug/pheromone exporter [Colletotrichum higginsianum IMI 349063]CCF35719.1 multidrug/pheromone exporter [Colletotrichum higginsianum]